MTENGEVAEGHTEKDSQTSHVALGDDISALGYHENEMNHHAFAKDMGESAHKTELRDQDLDHVMIGDLENTYSSTATVTQ